MPVTEINDDAKYDLLKKGTYFAVLKPTNMGNNIASIPEAKAAGLEPGDVFEVTKRDFDNHGNEGLPQDLHGLIQRGRIANFEDEKDAVAAAKKAKDAADELTRAVDVQHGNLAGVVETIGDRVRNIEAGLAAGAGGEGGDPEAAKALKEALDDVLARLDAIDGGEIDDPEAENTLSERVEAAEKSIEDGFTRDTDLSERVEAAEKRAEATDKTIASLATRLEKLEKKTPNQ